MAERTPSRSPTRYRTDEQDRIAWVDEGFVAFGVQNNLPRPSEVVGVELWKFIEGERLRHLYRELIGAARRQEPLELTFRCDSPAERRRMQMRLDSPDGREVEIETRCRCSTRRPSTLCVR